MRHFRARGLRFGVVAALLVGSVLVAYPFLPGHGPVNRVPYLTLVVIGISAALINGLSPSGRRYFSAPSGLTGLYVSSALYVALLTVLMGLSGGGRSPLVFLYAFTTISFVSSYPPRGQIGLLAFTYACFGVVVAATGTSPGAAVLFLELAVLGCAALMGAFLSGQLVEGFAAQQAANAESERRAQLLALVANATRVMTSLDPDTVLGSLVDAAAAIGFDAANLCVFEDGAKTYRVAHPRGLPSAYLERSHPIGSGMPGLVREHGATVVVNDYASHPRAIGLLRDAGFHAVIASPIWDRAGMVAVLVAGSRQRRAITTEEKEAFELLAGQAGMALANANRFEEERALALRLAELDRLKQDFMATVSHELRTPLTVVQGLGKTMAQRWTELADERRQDLLGRLNHNADALGATINTLLDFAQLEAGRLEARTAPFDLSALVAATVSRLTSLLGPRSLITSIEPGLWASGDQELLERVVENLVANAAKHTPDHTRVDVSVVAEDGGARVTVADDGPGISPEDLAHVGERFFRGGELATRRARGTGLGLAFARQVLALHGTILLVRSEVGAGATFSFAVPLVAGAQTAPAAPVGPAAPTGPIAPAAQAASAGQEPR